MTFSPQPAPVTLPAALVGKLLAELGAEPRLIWSARRGLHAAMTPGLVLDLGRELRSQLAPAPAASALPVDEAAAVAPRPEPTVEAAATQTPAPIVAVAADPSLRVEPHGLSEPAAIAAGAIEAIWPGVEVPRWILRGAERAIASGELREDQVLLAVRLQARSIEGWQELFRHIDGNSKVHAFRRMLCSGEQPTAPTHTPAPPAPRPAPAPPRRQAPARSSLIQLPIRAPSEMERRGSGGTGKPAIKGIMERRAEQLQAAIRHLEAKGFSVVRTNRDSLIAAYAVSSYTGAFAGDDVIELAVQRGFVREAGL